MKLNSAQVQRTLDQFEADVIPDENPVIAKLNDLFGEHTFFLDQHGLNIVEQVEAAELSAECAYVDERGGVGIRLEPAAAIVRRYGEQSAGRRGESAGLRR